jgi:hypothetical protein
MCQGTGTTLRVDVLGLRSSTAALLILKALFWIFHHGEAVIMPFTRRGLYHIFLEKSVMKKSTLSYQFFPLVK